MSLSTVRVAVKQSKRTTFHSVRGLSSVTADRHSIYKSDGTLKHPYLDYRHPSQPAARPYEYTDPMKDYGWHLDGAFFERPHVRRYTDAWQGDKKLFEATSEPLSGKQVVPMFEVPNIETRTLHDNKIVNINKELKEAVKDHVTLVTVSFSGIGLREQDTTAWQKAFVSLQASDKTFQARHIKYMDGFEYYFAPKLFTKMNKDTCIPEMQENTFVAFEPYHYNITLFTELAAIHNRALGFAYLVDKAGNIRWRAHGLPTDGETKAMVECAHTLAKEQ